MNKNPLFLSVSMLLMGRLFFFSCSEPIAPEFDFKEGLIYIEGFAATTPNASYVKISKSVFKFDRYIYEFVSGAVVTFRNTETDRMVALVEQMGAYAPKDDFMASPGESWELLVTLPDGRNYRSIPEVVTEPIPVADINFTYNPELLFREGNDSFLPGHFVSVDIDDPPGEDNYYYWSFRSFEKLRMCEFCFEGFFREGECEMMPHLENDGIYVGYKCESNCWRIRFQENIRIFSDEFTNGTRINALPVADVLLYSKEDIVIELQQFSLSKTAYDYYRILKDIIDNNGGINAPPAAALVGNMFNPNNNEEYVLGQFTAASSTIASIFIDRTDIPEEAIFGELDFVSECCPDEPQCFAPVFDLVPCFPMTRIPCSETRCKTAMEPPGWIEQ